MEDWLEANRVDVADDDVIPDDAAGKTRVIHTVLGKAAFSDGSDAVLVEYGAVGGAEHLRKVVPVASLTKGGDGDDVVDRVYQLWLDRRCATKSGGFGTLKQHLDLREREVHAGGGFDIITPSHRACGLVALLGNLAQAETMAGRYQDDLDDDESPPLAIRNSADPCLNGASLLNVWWNEDDVGNPVSPPTTNPPSSEVIAILLGVSNTHGMIEEVGGGHGLLQQLLAIQTAQPATRNWRFDQPRFSLRTRSLAIRLKSGRTEATPPLTLRSMVPVPPGRRLTKLVLLTLNRNSVPMKSSVISAAPSDASAEGDSTGAAAVDENDPKEKRKRQRLKRFERSAAPMLSPETGAAAKAKAELFSTVMARKRSAPLSTPKAAGAAMPSGGGDPMWKDYAPKKVSAKVVELLRLPWSKQAIRRRKWVEGPCTATCRDYHAVADVLNGTEEIPIVQPGGGGAASGASTVGPTVDVEITSTPLVLLEKSRAVRAAEKRLVLAELELIQSETQLIAWRVKHSTGENTCRHTLQRTKAQREQAVAVAASALAKAQTAQLREWNFSTAAADTNDAASDDEGGEASCTEPQTDASTTDDMTDAGVAPLVGRDQLFLDEVEDEDDAEDEVCEAGAPTGLDELLAACAEASEAMANQAPG
jgi:hypothetical protein